MHLLIVSATPRVKKNSNTDKIISKFVEGFCAQNDNSTECFYLSERDSWEDIRRAFEKNDNVLFALPLFVECIPGLMMAFLETLTPKTYTAEQSKTKLSFLLQGGFPEASQLRCCERYLEMLPAYLNCEYNGTLIKGDMFGISFATQKSRDKQTACFVQAGGEFAKRGCFDKAGVSDFAKPEYFPPQFKKIFSLMRPFQKHMFKKVAASMGCKEPLDCKPLQKFVQ